MRIISVDPAKYSTGVFCSNGYHTTIINSKAAPEKKIYQHISEEMRKVCAAFHPQIAIVEDYAFAGRNPKGRLQNAELKGVVKHALYEFVDNIIMMPIMTWKSYHLGILDKKKMPALYLEYARKLSGEALKTCDEADAYFFMSTLSTILKGAIHSPAAQKIFDQYQKVRGKIEK